MKNITLLGIDLAKDVFQLHHIKGADPDESRITSQRAGTRYTCIFYMIKEIYSHSILDAVIFHIRRTFN
ncbi:TPA: hypothetical protein F8R96_14710, partial [Legionella pneumophila]|nr:hypothetical protein [Legionella pneumophila]HBI2947801.1 hypothetical protein [Legionella pneumophila]